MVLIGRIIDAALALSETVEGFYLITLERLTGKWKCKGTHHVFLDRSLVCECGKMKKEIMKGLGK
jgi:hypothetical protein